MYEREQGAKRIAAALYSRLEDSNTIAKIAKATNYLEGQLKEDIKALYDYVTEEKEGK